MRTREAGFSMVDALISLFIWSTCVLFFLPLYEDMRQHLIEAKEAAHIAEVMEHAARIWQRGGTVEGQHQIDHITYRYTVQLPTICVTYTKGSEAKEVCKNFSRSSEDLHS